MLFTAGALFSAGCVTEGQPVLCAGVVDCPTVAFCITAEVVGAGNRVTAYAASLIAVVRRVLATTLRCCVAVAVVLLSDAARLQIAAEADTGKRFDHGDQVAGVTIKAFPGTPHFLHLLNEIFA